MGTLIDRFFFGIFEQQFFCRGQCWRFMVGAFHLFDAALQCHDERYYIVYNALCNPGADLARRTAIFDDPDRLIPIHTAALRNDRTACTLFS